MAVTFSFPSSITVSTFAYVSGTEDASSADGLTGAIRTLGGLSVAKTAYFGGALNTGVRIFGVSGANTDAPLQVTMTSDFSAGSAPTAVYVVASDGNSSSTDAYGTYGIKVSVTTNRQSVSGGPRLGSALEASYLATGRLSSGALRGVDGSVTLQHSSGTTGGAYGVMGTVTLNISTVGVYAPYAYAGIFSLTGGVAVAQLQATQAAAVRASVAFSVKATTLVGYDLESGINADPSYVTTAYGLRIGNVSGASGSNFAIYTGAGAVRFGDTTDATDATGITGALGILGGLSIAKKAFIGTTLSIGLVSEYADNAAALLAGLTSGTVYRTGDILKIVH